MFEIETTKETELISWQINKQKPKNKDNKETKQKDAVEKPVWVRRTQPTGV